VGVLGPLGIQRLAGILPRNSGQNESFCPVKVGWKSQAGEKPIAGRLEKAYFSIFR
jgi:hypothetical protein